MMMRKAVEELKEIYRFTSAIDLSEQQFYALLGLFNQPVKGLRSALQAENCIIRSTIPGIGPVVVKHYRRGGWLRRLISRHYLRWGAARSEREYVLLQQVREVGVNAPDVIAHASRGLLFYQAWLVTREISDTVTLADLSCTDLPRAEAALDLMMRQLYLLIEAAIFHVDLHPGNVLVDPNGKVYLIDFDKAQSWEGSKNKLRDLYLCRWRRAVIKHQLPEILSETASLFLRRNFEKRDHGPVEV